ncbi:hypothetical protein NEAUS04_0001 [Nematocida ausubeli]|uniref:Uncharacterized protein n=1 Tax=Nematocida ausubeli (strain ATCC PRA-371 / ERTm2) TaxID=1913371 RepID=H8ZCE1_NEMA1|nr:uncharacterized protein NESG_02206 [Nematocida ausubeli]EHY65777.1 hypothetical protein NERG_01384 [Nematocida ausubeli]KAI5132799.1 hypothetical protein NEAUS06_0345 [Nematocida ausubeli]KAI5135250.1 hypothetical protein NEAUS07_1086 [Nematocida ausubeli]KAI5148114.1 hypothetical protein NEAUS05_1261 [Nematocida ausubeli]KAI5160467.1 hypothetical protein NEAUS04_0001 [Nematocida ausubeli]
MEIVEKEKRREETEKELNLRVIELGNLMKVFREKVDSLEKTVNSLETKVVDYIQDLTKARGEIDI